jgi:hypothetical protein
LSLGGWDVCFVTVNGEGFDSVLEGITIDGGVDVIGGFMRIEDGAFTVNRCIARRTCWGLQTFHPTTSITLNDCQFIEIDGGMHGSGYLYPNIQISGGASINRCIFERNFAYCAATVNVGHTDQNVTISDCRFLGNSLCEGWGLMIQGDGAGSIHVSSCVFVDNSADAVWVFGPPSGPVDFSSCTFVGNTWRPMQLDGEVGVDNCLMAFNGAPVACPIPGATLTCCDIYGNTGGDWVGEIAGQYGVNGNISEDPLFCDIANDDFTLNAASPCAPANSSGCGLIGALPVGCGATAVESTTWGSIKASFK